MLVAERHRRSTLIALTVAGVAMLSTGCGASAPEAASRDALVVAEESASAQAGSAGSVRPQDPEAPATYQPVVRDGKRPTRTVPATAGRFSPAAPATYPDGVRLTIDRTARSVERGEGPGVFPGRPQTAVDMTLHNDSSQAVDLSQVVVTMTYGVKPRLASPVYENARAADFTGIVAPGGSAAATYVFSLPPGQAKSARMIVDLDGIHAPADFTGLEEQ